MSEAQLQTAPPSKVRRHDWRRRNVPYVVLLHLPTGNAAVYNRRYELISERASPALRTYAAFVDRFLKPGFNWRPEQRPSWLRPGMEGGCLKIFCYNDGDVIDTQHLASIPLA